MYEQNKAQKPTPSKGVENPRVNSEGPRLYRNRLSRCACPHYLALPWISHLLVCWMILHYTPFGAKCQEKSWVCGCVAPRSLPQSPRSVFIYRKRRCGDSSLHRREPLRNDLQPQAKIESPAYNSKPPGSFPWKELRPQAVRKASQRLPQETLATVSSRGLFLA